jgi:hypothetical protein
MGECFDEYIVSLNKERSGLIVARIRVESYCTPGYSCDPNEHTPPVIQTYNVQCKTPGGYIEYASPGPAHGQRTPEPERDPPHATQAEKDLWTAVCSGKVGR